jgi:hypothetical protein
MKKSLLMVVVIACAVAVLPSCAADEAPAAIQDPLKWFWRHYDDGSDADAARALVKLDGQLSAVAADSPIKQVLLPLDASDTAVVATDHKPDPKKAVGLLAVTEFSCKLDKVAEIIARLDQDKNYPDSYVSYKRTYRDGSNFEAWKNKTATRIEWDTELEASFGSAKESLRGGARRVPDLGIEQSPRGSFLMARTWLRKPAVFSDSDDNWPQDWQVEVYYERTPGKVVHAFAAWRQFSISIFSTDDTTVQNQMLDNFVKWDKQTEKLCAQ